MIEFFKTTNEKMEQLSSLEEGCWVKVTDPTEEEIGRLSKEMDVPKPYILDALDSEERSRIELKRAEQDVRHSLVIVDCPYESEDELGYAMYETLPIGIVLTKGHLVTISLRDLPILSDVRSMKLEVYETTNHKQFLLKLLYAVSYYYLKYLNQIIKQTNNLELQIKQSMKNEQLYAFMAVQKSLVFFATALQSNKAILDKMEDVEHFMQQEENHDLLRDVIIENKQAIAMTDTYTQIISGMSDVFSSVISNNLNIVMKFLTSFTIILSLPTIVASIYGMNIKLPFMHNDHAFALILLFTLLITTGVTVIFWRRKYF
ncbi:magnesium transporter CorA family protein [Listeria ivanovii]|uniref:magnesium transporter CorA family protein n=1 Tax=Listeria ivanovii TaxID=1638 RepID=UPI0005126E4A|nr:magnesium transporter CorA family protein [Listeria ivanovii]AIS61915.1 magnesium transporter [Listeria ivanovii subsp. londoniensis]MBK1965721.1 magnesium transporter CorA family protein [Listeria ivanovii subsp. londoniensis]MBK1985517.1 magnesium transporter CorA family protein [Listeria ivanovii subsp. londoniensis]MBK1994889.1 magnesium transporter CorA family protein [Listeria ivanovii subsp. londoniensis]MBM5607483.1 magnesium transporter CorA family protein [Listeria ivanovii]